MKFSPKDNEEICKFKTYYFKGVKHYICKLTGSKQRPQCFSDNQDRNFDVEIATK